MCKYRQTTAPAIPVNKTLRAEGDLASASVLVSGMLAAAMMNCRHKDATGNRARKRSLAGTILCDHLK